MDDEISSQQSTGIVSPTFLNPQNVMMGFIAIVTFGILFLCSIFFSLPHNVLSPSEDDGARQFFATVMPQKWVFAASAPGSAEITPYRLADNMIFSVSAFPNAEAKNFFGASRRQRAQIPEVQRLSSSAGSWADCGGLNSEEACILKTSQEILPPSIKNDSPSPSLCGDIILLESTPVPWSDHTHHGTTRLPVRATYLKIDCP